MFTMRAASSSLRNQAVSGVALQSRSRLFHASPATQKTVTERVSEVADKLNKSVGKGLASAIDKGENATHAAKDTLESATKETGKKTQEAESVVKQKGHQAATGAREAKEDMENELRK